MTAFPDSAMAIGALLRRAGLAVLLAVLAAVAPARADGAVKGTVTVAAENGFARLAFKFAEPVSARVHLAWPVLVINFKSPVDVAVDRLGAGAPDFVGAARLDPDGRAIRIALARKVKINETPAAERLYIDLLPENWSGMLPGLPKEVVEYLAERARAAERLLRERQAEDKQRPPPTVRIKVASQPTFTRFVFELPDAVKVVPTRRGDSFTLTFDRTINWDLADALAAMPPTLRTIKSDSQTAASSVSFVLKGAPQVHGFRDDKSFVVDISHDDAPPKSAAKPVEQGAGAPVLAITPPDTVPAKEAVTQPQAANADLPPLIDVPAPAAAKPPPAKMRVPKAAAPPSAPAPSASKHSAPAPMPPFAALAHNVPPPPALAAKPAAKPAPAAASAVPPPNPAAPVVVALHQDSDMLRLEFPFALPTPAAAFMRADVLWLVFDTKAKLDLAALAARARDTIRSVAQSRGTEGEAILRIRLKRPQLASLASDGPAWLLNIGDVVTAPPHPLGVARSLVGRGRANIVIPFDHPAALHAIKDPDIGDRLLVITALGPPRGFVRPRAYVELHLIASAQGVVVLPIADDVAAALAPDKITLGRPGGLSLSSADVGIDDAGGAAHAAAFNTQIWGYDRKSDFEQRQSELIRAAAGAAPGRRLQARLNLARFYLARHMTAEAKGVLDVALADDRGLADVTGSVLGAIADVMLDRPHQAIAQLNQPQIGNQLNAPLWRAIAFAREGKWVEARPGFEHIENAIATLPIELQRMAMLAALRTAIEVRDYNTASHLVDELESMGVPATMTPAVAVLVGRLDEGLGRTADALTNYRTAAAATDRPVAAEGRLREIALRTRLGDMPRKDAITALETLTTVWRGDRTEAAGLKLLAHLYTEAGRYRDAFHVMRVATLAHPNSQFTRDIQDEASASFETLFLSHKGDSLPPLDALALFYDYRELTPIGPRGDAMIRKLADRLVAVDLLDQAAELLKHQVDHRLQGAARAQVATHLAVIYLMNRKPERALATLRATRAAGLADDLRDQRRLLEARALSDSGRHDLALEIISDIKSEAADRLRADILWAAHRWRAAAEQIEKLYGDRWKKFAPLSASERFDILRAAVGYALADETLSLTRFRDRYMPKMAQGPDRRAFEVVSAPIGTGNDAFQDVARRVASVDTLDAFLKDLRTRYPEPLAAQAKTGGKGAPPQPAKPQVVPAKADEPTGSIAPADGR